MTCSNCVFEEQTNKDEFMNRSNKNSCFIRQSF